MNKIAIFFDAENVPAMNVPKIISFLSEKGSIVYQRAYADWSMPQMKEWQSLIDKTPAITPVQQFHHNKIKNAADYRIVMEAIEMLVKDADINVFVLVTSDSGFYYLVRHLREKGKHVFVLGEKAKKCKPDLREVCNEFHYIEDLSAENDVGKTPFTKEQLVEAVQAIQKPDCDGKNEYVSLSKVGIHLSGLVNKDKKDKISLKGKILPTIQKCFSNDVEIRPSESKKGRNEIRLKEPE